MMSNGAHRGFVAAAIAYGLIACGSNTPSIGTHVDPDAGGPSAVPHNGVDSGPDTGVCTPTESRETHCGDGIDNDCNGYTDCLDPACEGQSCGGAGLTCRSGACLQQCAPDGGMCLPSLPKIENVRVVLHDDTAIVEFEPVANALDYRIYPVPDPASIQVGAQGDVTIRNAIYRCAGDRPFVKREYSQSGQFDISLAGRIQNYIRTEPESVLGHVYLTPGPGRLAVHQVSNPNLMGGYAWDWGNPPGVGFNASEYVVAADVLARLLSQGWRDDGVVFYVPMDATRPIYRRQYATTRYGTTVLFYTDGPEHDARAKENPADVSDFGERFRVLAAPANGSVPLHRVFYGFANDHDVLAAGEARYQRVLHQGNLPVSSLTWPGLTATTTLIIEALDKGCPFPGGYIGPVHAASTGTNNAPTILLDEARLPSGEVFVNGQHDPTNRPTAIARAFVDVTPQAHPHMDWYEGFDVGARWEPAPLIAMNANGNYIYRNSRFSAEFAGCTKNHSFGPVLGQLVIGGGDSGSSCNMHIAARGIDARVAPDHYLHVRMATDVPSTSRRYPQLMITTAKITDIPPGKDPANPGIDVNTAPIGSHLGPMPFQHLPPGTEQTLVVQPFSSAHELQIEFCDLRGWGVSQQCARANLYGFHAGDYTEMWQQSWLPVPVLGELAGWDRPVRFDVYASTQRVYVFVDDKPGGCAVLPAGRLSAAPVTVVFGSVGYHMDIDESVGVNSAHEYLHTYSQNHIDRHMDDFGIELSAALPVWDEAVLPCGAKWYGESK